MASTPFSAFCVYFIIFYVHHFMLHNTILPCKITCIFTGRRASFQTSAALLCKASKMLWMPLDIHNIFEALQSNLADVWKLAFLPVKIQKEFVSECGNVKHKVKSYIGVSSE